MQAMATGVETGIVGVFSAGGMGVRTVAKVMWMMARQGLMLPMTGEPNGSLCPQTGTARLVVAEASRIGETKAGTKGRMQVIHPADHGQSEVCKLEQDHRGGDTVLAVVS